MKTNADPNREILQQSIRVINYFNQNIKYCRIIIPSNHAKVYYLVTKIDTGVVTTYGPRHVISYNVAC